MLNKKKGRIGLALDSDLHPPGVVLVGVAVEDVDLRVELSSCLARAQSSLSGCSGQTLSC